MGASGSRDSFSLNGGDEGARSLALAAAARDKEAGAWAAVVKARVRHGTCDGGPAECLPCGELVNALRGDPAACPRHGIVEGLRARAGHAVQFALPAVVVDCGLGGVWELCEQSLFLLF